jgi:uncharacterized protein YjbI with pentapeptide repeats
MAKPDQVAQLMKGAADWNAWRRDNYNIGFDLSRANLSGANLSGALLFKANLFDANLSGANLSKASIHDANLQGANLSKANLTEADLSKANLIQANLTEADLSRANLSGAGLGWADLTQANLNGANLSGANLSGANFSRANLFKAFLNRANLEAQGFAVFSTRAVEPVVYAELLFQEPGGGIKGDIQLRRTNLNGANLTEADLSGANLYGADLSTADLHGANLHGANFSAANLSSANLRGANLTIVTLVNTELTGADLTGCRIFGLSAWGLKLDGAKQQNLIITSENEPQITVDHIEVAQFVYLMLHNEKIRDVIDTITSKAVLILGRFTDKRKAVLDALREELRKRNYLPILFDFDVPATRDITETVTLLARMARFIIADLTDPSSIPKELEAIVPSLAVPVQPLLESPSRPFSMFKDCWKYDWVLPVYQYEGLEQLLEKLPEKVIAPPEGKVKALQERRHLSEAELTKPQ